MLAGNVYVHLQDEEMAMSFGVRQWCRQCHGEPGGGVTVHAVHLGHRKAGREETANTARDQVIAGLNIGASGEIADFHFAVCSAAKRNEPEAVAQDLHGNGQFVVRDECRFGGEGCDPYDLAYDATLVNDGHSRLYAAGATLIEYKVMIESAGGFEEDLD